MKIGIAIPCYHGHIQSLLELLDIIEKQTRLPDKVAISCSSTDEFPELKNYGFLIETVVTKDKKSAAENRNIASSKLMDMDYITFFDADDLMHPQRIEILCIVCQNYNSDIILHNYYNIYMNDVSLDPIQYVDVHKNSLCQCYSGCVRHKEQHYGDIHHGHVTVKRNILDLVQFPEEIEYHTKEDSVFCNRVVGLPNIETSYINNKLSYYKPSRTGGINDDITKRNYDNVAFITLTNSGYIDYTLNCLESLKKINSKINLTCYCIGTDGYNKLKENNFQTILIEDDVNSNFQTFRNGNWSNITYYKFKIIYENLLLHEYVCITDGDIVYENNFFMDFLLDNIDDNDLLAQSEGIEIDDFCTGFMFIKSNPKTLSLFNPENVEKYKNVVGWDDQIYINEIRNMLKYKKLPLYLFPTGKYYYTYFNYLKPYLIHFNWLYGHDKMEKMIKHNKWFIQNNQ